MVFIKIIGNNILIKYFFIDIFMQKAYFTPFPNFTKEKSMSAQATDPKYASPINRHLSKEIEDLRTGDMVDILTLRVGHPVETDRMVFKGFAVLDMIKTSNGIDRDGVTSAAIFQSTEPCRLSGEDLKLSFGKIAGIYRNLDAYSTQPISGDTARDYGVQVQRQLGFAGENPSISGRMIPVLSSFTKAVHTPYKSGKPFYPIRVLTLGSSSTLG